MSRKEEALKKFHKLRKEKKWDEAQKVIDDLSRRFPNNEEVQKLSSDFTKERMAYDTEYLEQTG